MVENMPALVPAGSRIDVRDKAPQVNVNSKVLSKRLLATILLALLWFSAEGSREIQPTKIGIVSTAEIFVCSTGR